MNGMIGCRRPSLTLALLAATAVGASAQTTPALAAAPLTFDVASIHPHTPLPHEGNHIWNSASDGNFRAMNISLKAIIQYAFSMPESRIIDAPAWIASQPFDIDAKSDDAVNQRLHDLASDQAKPIKLAMIQALLAERFGLKTRREQRELPIYQLVVAKAGSKLTPSEHDGLHIDHWNNRFSAQGITLPMLAQELARDAGRIVIDQTNLPGRFDIDLHWQADDAPANNSDAAYPPFFTALQEQLGLRLEPDKGPVEVLVVGDVHQPTAN